MFVAGLRAAGLSVNTLVGAHDLCDLTFLHECLEGGQIGLPEVALGQVLHVEFMTVPLRTAVYGKVLRTGQQLAVLADAEILAIVAHTLQATDDGQSHLGCQVGVFTIGLLSASPTGITEDIDVRCPERQTLIALDVARALGLLCLHASLVAHGCKHLVQQGIVPRGSHTHRDREHGGKAVTADAVQGFVPPLELGDAESLDGGRGIHHQTYFLFKSQSS